MKDIGLNKELIFLVKEAMASEITKDQFKEFIKNNSKKKNENNTR
ncbi:hypothetical protein [Rossellomorea sp. BNER]